MDPQRKEELSSSQVPQLETCPQCRPDHVRHAEDWQNGAVHV